MRIRAAILASALAATAACDGGLHPPARDFHPRQPAPPALFTNGGFESGNMGSWAITTNLNKGINYPPASVADLMLKPGGNAFTFARAGTTEATVPAGMSAASTLRYPKFGGWSAVINELGANQNVNTITQSMVTTAADVDPSDGLIHVRFLVAPVMENPGHANTDQPYYYVVVSNTTQGTTLFSRFNYVNEAGVPWQTDVGVKTPSVAVLYTGWQTVDVPGTAGSIATGDAVQVQVIAAGCALGGHWGEAYVDGFGAFLPGLSIVASAPQMANAGSNITTRYAVNNSGATLMTNVTAVAPMPSQTTFVSLSAPVGAVCTTPPVGGSGNVTCNFGSMNPSSALSFSIVTAIGAAASGIVSNGSYTIQGGGGTTLLGPLVTTTITAAVSYSDLSVTMTDGIAATGWGLPVTYTIVVSNAGPATATNLTVKDTIPAQLTGATWTCAITTGTGSCGAASGSGTINTTATLQAGAKATYTLSANIIAGSGTSRVTNVVNVATVGTTDPYTPDNRAADTDDIGPVVTVTVTKDATGAGQGTVVSSPAAINCGPACASASASFVSGGLITFTATAVPGDSFAGWSGACSGVASTCNISPVAAATVTAKFVLQSFNITASVPAGNGTLSCTSPVLHNQSSTCTAAPAAGYKLTQLTDNAADVTAAVVANVYTISAVAADHAMVATFLKDLGTLCGGAGECAGGICVDGVCCNQACNGQCQACDAAGSVGTCTAVAGAPHGARSACASDGSSCGGACDGVTIAACAYPGGATTCRNASCAAGTATSAASCIGTGACPAPSTTACTPYICGATACKTSCVADPDCIAGDYCNAGACALKNVDLSIVASGPASIAAGSTAAYNLAVSNAGPAAGSGISVTYPLPANVTYASSTGSGAGWTCVSAAGTVTCSLTGALAVGAAPALVVNVSLAATATGSVSSTFSVGPTAPDPNTANNSSTSVSTVTVSADLSIVTTGPASITAGASASYSLAVSNAGPSVVSGVTVTYPLPANVTYASSTGSGAGWSCVSAAGTVTCSLTGSLAAGAAPALVVNVNLAAGATGTVTSTFSVAPTATDPSLANNSSAKASSVTVSADLSIVATGPASITAGTSGSYSLAVSNAGPSVVSGVTVTYPLPANVTYASSTGSGAGWSCASAAGTVTCSLTGSLAVGAAPALVVNVNLAAAATGSVSSTFSVGPGATDPSAANNSSTSTASVAISADLSIVTTGPASITAGTPATYNLAVSNAGPSAVGGVTVTYSLPANVTYVSSAGSGAGWSCVSAAGTVTCSLTGSLAVSAAPALVVNVSLAGSATGTVSSTFSVGPAASDPSAANNSSTSTASVAVSADLSIVTTGPASIAAGAAASYSLAVSNAGPSAVSGVTVTYPLPANVTYASSTGSGAGWSCVSAAGTVTCSLTGSLAVGAAPALVVNVDLAAAATGSVSSTFSVGPGASDPNAANNSSTSTSTVTVSADLSIAATGPASIVAGTSGSYSLAVSNAGPSVVSGVTVTYPLPANVTYASSTGSGAGWSCASASGTVTCSLAGSLAVGPAPALVVNVNLAAGATGSVSSTFSVGPSASDPSAANNSSTASSGVTISADLSVSAAGPASITAGTSGGYSLAVSNAGPSVVSGVAVSYPLPGGVAYASSTGSGAAWSCVSASGTVTCSLAGPLAVGAAPALVVNVTLAAGATGTVSSTFSVGPSASDPNAANNSSTSTATVAVSADLSIAATGPASITAGTPASYGLAVGNSGPSAVSGVTVTYPLPAGVTYASSTGSGAGWSCVLASSTVTCSLAGSLAVGAAPALVVNVNLAATATGSVSSTFSVGPSASDPNAADNSSTSTSTVAVSADLSIAATGPASIIAGTSGSYSLAVANAGPSVVGGVTVSYPLPAGVSYASSTGSGAGWSCVSASGTVTCSRAGSLAVGAAPALVINVNLAATATGSVSSTFSVGPGASDPAAANNSSTSAATIAVSADLSIAATGPAAVSAGLPASYSLTVANAGPSVVSGVTVTYPLPANVSYANSTGSGAGWSCVSASGTVTCSLAGSLAAGAAPALVVNVSVGATATGTVSSTFTVGPGASDPSAANNSSTSTATVAVSADLSIAATGPASITAGTPASYSLAVDNAGPSAVSGVAVSYPLPAGVTYASSTGAAWSCASAGGTVTCSLTGPLAAGAAPALSITVNLAAAATGSISSTFAVGPTADDPSTANNSATADATVAISADVSLVASGPATLVAGTSGSYAIAASNGGPSSIGGVSVTWTVPAEESYTGFAGAGWSCSEIGGVVTCALSGALLGAAPALSLQFGVLASALPGPVLAGFDAGPTANDPAAGNNHASVASNVGTVADLDLSLTITSTPANPPAGALVTYTAQVTNNGPSDAQLVTVVMTLPAGFTSVAASGPGWTCSLSTDASDNTVVTCTIPFLGVGAAPPITVTADAPLSTGDVTVATGVGSATPDPTPGNNSTSPVTTVVPASADLSVSLSAPATVQATGGYAYAVAVANAGPSPAMGVSYSQALPVGAAFLSSSGAGWTCSAAGSPQVVSCTLAGLLGYGTAAPALDILVAASAEGASASSTGTVSSSAADPQSGNDSSTATIEVQPVSDLSAALAAPASVTAAAALAYDVTLSNAGPSSASGIAWTQALAPGSVFVDASGSDLAWSCSAAGTAVTCTLSGSVAASAQAPALRINAVAPPQGGPISSSGAVGSSSIDPNSGNDGASAGTQVDASADLSIAAIAPASVTAGTAFSYALAVSNAGPSSMSGVAVAYVLPAGVSYAGFAGAGWSCAASGGVVTCALSGALAGPAPALSVDVALASSAAAGVLQGSFLVLPTASDPDLSNNTSTAPSTVAESADVSVSLAQAAATVPAGAATTYTLSIGNAGPSDAQALSASLSLPAGFTAVVPSGSGWSCGTAAGPLGSTVATCSRATLAAGAASGISVAASAPLALGDSIAAAFVSAATADPAAGNNSAAVTTTVTAASADLSIALAGPAAGNAGIPMDERVTVHNAGPSPGVATVTLPLPPGAAFLLTTSSNWTCSFAGGVVGCTLTGTLAPGADSDLVLRILPPPDDAVLTLQATVSGSGADPNASNDVSASLSAVITPEADLSVSLSPASSGSAAAAAVSFTASAANAGPSVAHDVSLTVALPAGFTGVSAPDANGFSCSVSGTTATCTLSSLASGAAASIAVAAVAPSTAGLFAIAASVSSSIDDASLADNSAGASLVVGGASSDLALSLSGAATARATDVLAYTAAVSNAGPSPANAVSISFLLPAGSAPAGFSGAGWTCAPPAGGNVSCTYGSPLAAGGATAALLFSLASPPEGGAVTLSGQAASTSADPNPADNSASATTQVDPEADLGISIVASANAVPSSAPIRYTLSVANAGPSTAQAAVATLTLPAGYTGSTTAAGGGWSCSTAAGAGGATVVTCTLASLAPGSAPAIVVDAAAPATEATYSIDASISSATADPVAADDSAALSTVVSGASADLSISLSGPATAVAASNLAFSIGVANAGPSSAPAVQVVLPLPAGTAFVSGTGAGWTCATALVGGANSVVCTLATPLAAGDAAPALSVQLTAPAEGGFLGTSARVSSDAADPVGSNDLGGPLVTQISAQADLAVTLAGAPDPTPAGGAVDFTAAVTSTGPSTADSVSVNLVLPAGVAVSSASGAGWTCSTGAAQATCTRSSLAPGSAPAITVRAVAPASAGTLAATVTVSSATADATPANDAATASVSVVASADLSLTAAAAGPVFPGAPIAYAVVVANAGPSAATGVTFDQTLPAGATYLSGSGTGWTCSASGASVQCAYAGTLAAGGAAPLTLSTLAPSSVGAAVSSLSVSAGEPDPAPANNFRSVSYTVDPLPPPSDADLAVTIDAQAGTLYSGDRAGVTLHVRNLGPADAQSVTLSLSIPGGAGVTVSGNGWSCSAATCTRAALAVGAVSDLLLQATLADTAIVTASVTAASADPVPSNDSASSTVTVLRPPVVQLAASATPSPVVVGEALSYRVVVSNMSGSDAQGVSVTQALPAGATFTAAVGAGWTCAASAGSVTCTCPAPLAAGSALELIVTVAAPQVPGNAASTVAVATSTPNAAAPQQTQATVTTPVVAKPEVGDYYLAGRGCASGGGVGPEGLFALALLALVRLFRRRKGAALALLALAAAGGARAQSSTGIDVQQFKPMPGSFDILGVQSAHTAERGGWRAALVLNSANDPLGLVDPADNKFVRQVVDSQTTATALFSYGIFDRLEVGAMLPLTFQHTQPLPSTPAGPGETPASAGLGDLQIIPKLRLLELDHGLTLSASLPLVLPLAGGRSFLGQTGVGVQPRAIAEWDAGWLRVAANLGFNLRQAADLFNVHAASAFAYGLAGEMSFGPLKLLGRPLLAQATLVGALGLGGGTGRAVSNPAEIMGSVVWRLGDRFSLQAGGGPGLTQGYGTPAYRALVSVSWTERPAPSDRDHDGIADAQDACPDVPGVASADPARNGCPLPPPDRDHDGIADAQDACPDVPGVASGDPARNGCPLPPPDRDKDGIADAQDACPDVPGVASADPARNGCPLDRDKDGIADAQDACPDVPGVASADPAKNGCPADRDGDGIADADDACPDVAGVRQADKSLNGCPLATKERKVVLEGRRIIILEKVHFLSSKDAILLDSHALLTQVAASLLAHPEIELVSIEGHTDDKGKAPRNLDLSRRRAQNVRKFLLKAGIDAGRLQAKGYGRERPIDSNATEAGREHNRRVEFRIERLKSDAVN